MEYSIDLMRILLKWVLIQLLVSVNTLWTEHYNNNNNDNDNINNNNFRFQKNLLPKYRFRSR
jgi:hypothetical protein